MKILHLCPDPGIPVLGQKGAAVHVREMAAAFERAGHKVILAAPQLNKSPWEESSELVDGRLLHVPPGPETVAAVLALKKYNDTLGLENSLSGELRRILHDQEFGLKLKRKFENHRPNFIYERASLYATAGVHLARDLERPLIVELNAPLALEQRTYRATGLGDLAAQAERWTLEAADAVLTVSSLLREYAISLGVEPEHVHVVPNGVDIERFRPGAPDLEVRKRWNLGDGPVLGFVGGLRPWHGVEALPALLASLIGRYPAAQLVIAGDGPLRGALERDLQDRGFEKNAVFTGWMGHREVAPIIRHFDIALAPYPRPEHAFYFSPLKHFEYMACGIPVVTTNLGQIPEIVHDGETGLLCPPGEHGALVAACERLLDDPELRSRLGRAAAKEIHTHYTWDRNAERVAEIAESLIAKRRLG
jgi:glycosyltransferase involved in cell wall biosynthesis